MGSAMNNDDIIGLKMTVEDQYSFNTVECDVIDGSGFYDCNLTGRYIKLEEENGNEFTICEVTFYTEANIITSVDAEESD